MGCKNKRTLKKRIRRIVSLCIFLTIVLFGTGIIYLSAQNNQYHAKLLSKYYSYFIGSSINSDYFLKQMDIEGLEYFNPDSPKAQEWLQSLASAEKNQKIPYFPDSNVFIHDKNIDMKHKKIIIDQMSLIDEPPMLRPEEMTQVAIEFYGKVLFRSHNLDKVSPPSGFSDVLTFEDRKDLMFLNYFRVETSYPLLSSQGTAIGSVTVKIDPGYLLYQFIFTTIFVTILAFICLIAAFIISKFLTIPVTKPLSQLDEKIKLIASGDLKSTISSQIILKKPLMEIESLAFSTNQIMMKMREYSEILETQKITLENQNEELEAQNEQLSESKRQIEEAQALLVQSQNMASIGQLTAAITHEINTPLGAINSNVQISTMLIDTLLSNSQSSVDTEFTEMLGQLKEANGISVMACDRVIQIIKSLKSFSKLDQSEFQEADINECIKSVLILTSNLWKRKIVIHEKYGLVPLTRCYPGLLNQVFMNIIVNAIQAIQDTGEILIQTYQDNENVYVDIKDTGCGILEENLPKIFDSGFSTKGIGVGAGLGLSICSNIIKKHHGDIKVSSEVGKGTQFTVQIPINPYVNHHENPVQ